MISRLPLAVTQWLHLSDEACSAERMNLRNQLSHRMADLTQESGFQLIASHSAQGTCLHIKGHANKGGEQTNHRKQTKK